MLRKLISWFLWHGEDIGAEIVSRIFWPPNAAACTVISEEKILAVDAGEYLMLPGGIAEKGELLEETAAREVKEETGLEVEVKEELEENIRGPGTETIFRAELSGGELSSSWEGKPVWIPLEEVEARNWRYNRDVEALVEKAEKKMQKTGK